MSLINQMLMDLDQRRAQELGVPGTLLQGINRYRVVSHRGAWRTWLAAAIILLLIGSLGVLLWERQRPVPLLSALLSPAQAVRVEPARSQPSPRVPHAAPVSPSVPRGDPVVNQRSAAARPQPVRKVKTARAAVTPATRTKKHALKSASGKRNGIGTEESPLMENAVEKRPLALSATQKAEKIYQHAYALMAQGKAHEAGLLLQRALQQQPNHTRARELLAGSYITGGRYVEAAQVLQQGRKIQPRHWLFTRLYARVLLQQQQLDAAINVLKQAPPAIGQDPQYHALLAALYQRQGDHRSASKTYQELLHRYPRQGIWWVGLGISREKLGQHRQAALAYHNAAQSGSLPGQLRNFTADRLNNLPGAGEADE